ncbi:MAG: hypothetical protein QOJ64_4052 [Acidobacteriota bacterium]|nr:hypothetical protein [Acidobacteriota bacterium]
MKVVRIIARLNVGGPARHVVWLTAGLRSAGCESILVAGVVPPGEDDLGYFATEHGVEPIIIPQMSREISPRDVLTIWKLYRLFVRERPDIVHTHTAKAGTVGRLAGMLYRWLTPATLIGRPRRCRFVHTYHGHIFHSYYGKLKTRVFLAIEKALALMATDKIIVISPQQFQEIHEQFGVGRVEQFTVIPLGVDLSVYANWQVRRSVMRQELAVEDPEVLVGIVGRLTEVKNHALLLRAAAHLRHTLLSKGDHRPVRFLIIGDGHLRGTLESMVRELRLEDDVKFLGSRKDPENFYPALDIVALTSLNEGTPLTLIEAMANARPVVATTVGGVVDLLGDKVRSSPATENLKLNEHGIGVQPDNSSAFSEAIAYLIQDEATRRTMGECGRQFVERKYSRDRLITDVMELYRKLAPGAEGSQVPDPGSQVKRDSSNLDIVI